MYICILEYIYTNTHIHMFASESERGGDGQNSARARTCDERGREEEPRGCEAAEGTRGSCRVSRSYIYMYRYIAGKTRMYTYVYIYIYIYMCIYVHVSIYICICIYMYVCIYIHMTICAYVCIHTHMRTCTRTCVCAYIYAERKQG